MKTSVIVSALLLSASATALSFAPDPTKNWTLTSTDFMDNVVSKNGQIMIDCGNNLIRTEQANYGESIVFRIPWSSTKHLKRGVDSAVSLVYNIDGQVMMTNDISSFNNYDVMMPRDTLLYHNLIKQMKEGNTLRFSIYSNSLIKGYHSEPISLMGFTAVYESSEKCNYVHR